MRRAVLAEALSCGTLHIFCSGDAVLFDCYMPSENTKALSEEDAAQFKADKIKYDSVTAAVYTSDICSRYWNEKLGSSRVFTSISVDRSIKAGLIDVNRISIENDSKSLYTVYAGNTNILICGEASAEKIAAAAGKSNELFDCVFLSAAAVMAPEIADIAAISRHIFVYDIQLNHDEADDVMPKLEKRILKLKKKNINIRLIRSYPSGLVI